MVYKVYFLSKIWFGVMKAPPAALHVSHCRKKLFGTVYFCF